MTSPQVCNHIREVGIVPAIRVASADDAYFVAETVIAGGIPVVEVTTTVPGALSVISELRRRHPPLVVGAGTVVATADVPKCVDAGALFVTSPGFDPEIVAATRKWNVAAIPGALTPTEIMEALKAGADMIKVFPCAQVGGAGYIKAIRAPFPKALFIAAGGVHQETAAHFIEAGATALGIREDLIPRQAIHSRNADWIRELAHRFRGIVERTRAEVAALH